MVKAFVSIGSNIDPEENTSRALRALSREVHILAISTVYLTEPENRPEQPPYYNCVLEIETDLPPLDLKRGVLRRIEAELGRTRGNDAYTSRTIDLDLILYGGLVMTTDELMLPDPDIVRRSFLAIPLQELAPGLHLPGSRVVLDTAAAAFARDAMTPLATYTECLRKELIHGRKK
jgi:dihydroneopterin aldolase/2-amino-4-hydroxy-6-hydroxymethyldihydropteridine diphosphokinase